MYTLLITFIVGLFFMIGALVSLYIKNKNNLISFSLGISFILMILLALIDILPECLELFSSFKYLSMISGILIGFGTLLILDKLVPHHHSGDDHNHLIHIGVMTSITLILHNIVEGIGISAIIESSLKAGIIYAIGVALHNIPFGIKITTMLSDDKKKMWIYTVLLTLSTFAGGVLVFGFSNILSNFLLGSLLSITMGMIIYIVVFELYSELKENFNKYSIIGLITGAIIMFIGSVI